MADRIRCRCARCRMAGLTWPAVLITVGVLFLVQEYSGRYGFGELWPVILIVVGVIKVAEALTSNDGHVAS
jgi:hypothetical protein